MAERISVLVKFPPELLARVQAHAGEAGVDRMAAILALIEHGLGRGAEPVLAGPPEPKGPLPVRMVVASSRGHTTVTPGLVSLGRVRPQHGARLKEAKK